MPEIARLTGASGWLELDFVERERTPRRLMKLGIRLHLAGLSLLNTVSELEKFGVRRSPKAVHDWIQKADLQPASGACPNHVALDETVIRINDEQYWLYAAVDPETNRILHSRLFPDRNTAMTERFLRELKQKHDFVESLFLVDSVPWLQTALSRHNLRFQHVTHGNRNAVERVYREVKPRTSSFSNCFSHVDPATAETWLLAHARWHNSIN